LLSFGIPARIGLCNVGTLLLKRGIEELREGRDVEPDMKGED
jgi:hypothetical protein